MCFLRFLVAVLASLAFSCSAVASALKPSPDGLVVGEITGDMADTFVQALEKAASDKAPFITVTIDSPGGSVYAGLRMLDAIRNAERAGTSVICTADGIAASMAAVLLENCTSRLMTKRSAIMFHGVSTGGIGGNEAEIRRIAQFMGELNRFLAILASHRLNISLETYISRTDDKNWWLGYAEALEVGAVDAVL